MKLKGYSAVFALIGFYTLPCWGAGGADSFDFLFLDANARPVGLGGAYTASAEDANALLYNPAGLGRVARHEATFMHNRHFEGISQEYLAYASPKGFGANLNFLSFGEAQRTTISNPGGSGLGTAGMSDLALGFGYGRRFGENASLGAGLKYIRESIAGTNAQGLALDLGGMFRVRAIGGLKLGAAVQNLGPAVKFQSKKENLPLNMRFGGAYGLQVKGRETLLALDLSKSRSDSLIIGLGVEAAVAKTMPVRLGFNTRNDAGPGVTVGMGWVYKDFNFDYAFVPYGDLGSAHRLSATVKWGSAEEDGPPPRKARPVFIKTEAKTELSADDHFAKAEERIAAAEFLGARLELNSAHRLLDEKDQRLVRYFERLGTIAYREGSFGEARSRFQEALRVGTLLGIRSAHVADAYYGAGLCLAKESDPAAADYFAKALEAGPSPQTKKLVDAEISRLKPSPAASEP